MGVAGRGRRVLLYPVGEPNGGRYLVAGGSNICSLAVRASLWKSRKYGAPLVVEDWNYSSTRRENRDGRDLSTTPTLRVCRDKVTTIVFVYISIRYNFNNN